MRVSFKLLQNKRIRIIQKSRFSMMRKMSIQINVMRVSKGDGKKSWQAVSTKKKVLYSSYVYIYIYTRLSPTA